MTAMHEITVKVNGEDYACEVEGRLTLADFLRHHINLTGTHLGCEHGVCGACTVLVNGKTARGCLMLAVQADESEITTVEGLAVNGELNDLQQAFMEHHALQCGFCTPGMLMTLTELLQENPHPKEQDVRDAISGNICRCTGYQGIVAAVLAVAEQRDC